jgi:hypothetical protein
MKKEKPEPEEEPSVEMVELIGQPEMTSQH